MTVLRERVVWRRRDRPLKQGKRPGARIDALTAEQEASVRAWLRVLHDRLGRWRDVADGLHVSIKSLERVLAGTRRPTAGWALRVAALAGASVDEVLHDERTKGGPGCNGNRPS